jgi:CRP-like cAMP-binding protein
MLMKIPEGTVILKEGEVNMDMYKIVSGSVEAYTGYGTEKESILGIMGKGQYFGEIGLLSQKPSIYTIVAYSDVAVMRITMNELDDYIRNNHHDIYEIMRKMAETMYNMKYSMDMVMDDMQKAKEDRSASQYKAFFAKQFAKYNVQRDFPNSMYNLR